MMSQSSVSPPEEHLQGGGERPRLGDLRSHITCVLCAGYFIDATTIVECLHTFCRSCILRHLEASSYCPVCDVMIHRTKGSSSLRADRILQTMVYKLVPGLFREEMKMRRQFYDWKPYADPELPSWAKGDVASYAPHVYIADEHVHVRLALFDSDRSDSSDGAAPDGTGPSAAVPPVRYLRCQAGTPLTVLQKFVRTKFQISPTIQVQLIYGQHVLPDDISLLDVGYLHRPPQDAPMRLEYRFVRKRPAAVSVTKVTTTSEPAAKRPRTADERRQPVVLLERMFDVDDEEPTSPKEVEDIIASLDAEETVQPATSQSDAAASSVAEVCAGASEGGAGAAEVKEQDEEAAAPRPPSRTDIQSSGNCSGDRPPDGGGDATDNTLSASRGVCAAAVAVASEAGDEVVPPGDKPAVGDADDVAGGGDTMTSHGGEQDPERDTNSSSSQRASPEDQHENVFSSAISGKEMSSSDLSPSADAGKSSMTVEPVSDALTVADREGASTRSESDGESTCDDTTSECALVVDEEIREASPNVMEDGVANGSERASSCPAVEHEEKDDGATGSEKPSTALGTCTDTLLNSPDTVACVEAVRSAEESSEPPVPEADSGVSARATPERASHVSEEPSLDCAPAPEAHVSQASGDGKPASSDATNTRDTGSQGCDSPSRESGSRTDTVFTSPTSCGAKGLGTRNPERTREPPTKVDCSVQTVPTAPVKRTHKRPVLAGCTVNKVPREAAASLKQTSQQKAERETVSAEGHTGVGGSGSGRETPNTTVQQQVEGPSLKETQSFKRSIPNAAQPVKRHIHEAFHPELVHRLQQSKDGNDHPRNVLPTGVPRTCSANVLKIPNISSSKYGFHRTEPRGGAGGAAKPVSHKTAAHSPDSSSTADTKPLTDTRHFFKETPRHPNSVAKYLQKHHKRALTGTPLDLSTRASKTAADSTSMIPKRTGAKAHSRKPKPAKGQSTQTIHSIVKSLSQSEHISLTPIPSSRSSDAKTSPPPKRAASGKRRSPPGAAAPAHFPFSSMGLHDIYSSPLHVNTSMASRLGYDMAMRNLLTLSHMAMAQGGMVRPHMFPMQPMFPPPSKGHDFPTVPDPSLLRQPSEAGMGITSKKASPTAGTTAPQLQSPTALTSASIQHMEDLARAVGKRADKERHSVTLTAIPLK